jgi:hypothetical protein
MMQILVANTPRMYREALALAAHRHNPDFEVRMADPASVDEEAAHASQRRRRHRGGLSEG